MLSDEEKKEYIEHEILDRLYCLEENDFDKNKVDDGYIKAVLNACKEAKNLIEKQSKEIEELKKDKLELINKNHVVHLKDVEKELREMKKVIDTKNAEIECLNVIHESYKEMVEENNFISKDKIKAKIEELDEEIKVKKEIARKPMDRVSGRLLSDNIVELEKAKKVLQSLLEKE